MIYLQVNNLTKSFPDGEIFSNVNFNIKKGQKVGLIGINGSGKTTLFNIITNKESADSGEINTLKNIKISCLSQIVNQKSELTVLEYVREVFDEVYKLEKRLRELEILMQTEKDEDELDKILKEYERVNSIYEKKDAYSIDSLITGTLKGLKVKEDAFDQCYDSLSGGQKRRVELAKALLSKPDILLLDEPTNHLDLEGISFLENFIRGSDMSFLIISHDRYFLDRTVESIFLLSNKTIKEYKGNYSEFRKKRNKDLEDLRRLHLKEQKEIKRQKEIIEKLKNVKQSQKDKAIVQAKSRQKILDKMETTQFREDDSTTMKMRFTPRIRSGKDVLKVKKLKKSFDEKTIFENITFDIYNREHNAIIGANGVGKSTLFNIIMGKQKPDSGEVKIGSAVNIAYFDQELKSLDENNSVIEELWNAYPMMDRFEIRKNLAAFSFFSEDIEKTVGKLSGGEKARLSLLKLMLSDANFILMDEPTNHLDIDSKEFLEEAILKSDATILFISHDRYFLNKVSHKTFEMTENKMNEYLGNFDYYLEKKQEEKGEIEEQKVNKTAIKKMRLKQKDARLKRKKQKEEIAKLEKRIEEAENKINNLQQLLQDQSLYEDSEEVERVLIKLKEEEEILETLMDEYFELNE